MISILFMLNSHNTDFDNLTVSIALPVTARELGSRSRKSESSVLDFCPITICTDTNTSAQDAEIALG